MSVIKDLSLCIPPDLSTHIFPFPFVPGSNILLSMVVQQRVVILEFLQEKMSKRPSTPPSLRERVASSAGLQMDTNLHAELTGGRSLMVSKKFRDLSGGPRLRIHLPMQGTQVWNWNLDDFRWQRKLRPCDATTGASSQVRRKDA